MCFCGPGITNLNRMGGVEEKAKDWEHFTVCIEMGMIKCQEKARLPVFLNSVISRPHRELLRIMNKFMELALKK